MKSKIGLLVVHLGLLYSLQVAIQRSAVFPAWQSIASIAGFCIFLVLSIFSWKKFLSNFGGK